MGLTTPRAIIRWTTLAVLATLSGCIGMYDNTDMFLNDPPVGMTEGDVLKQYGTPSFMSESSGEKYLTYKVRDTKYIILVGMYDGYDLIVKMQNGSVVENYKVSLPKSFSLFQPWPWLVTQ